MVDGFAFLVAPFFFVERFVVVVFFLVVAIIWLLEIERPINETPLPLGVRAGEHVNVEVVMIRGGWPMSPERRIMPSARGTKTQS